jgi:hypothetical protein
MGTTEQEAVELPTAREVRLFERGMWIPIDELGRVAERMEKVQQALLGDKADAVAHGSAMPDAPTLEQLGVISVLVDTAERQRDELAQTVEKLKRAQYHLIAEYHDEASARYGTE